MQVWQRICWKKMVLSLLNNEDASSKMVQKRICWNQSKKVRQGKLLRKALKITKIKFDARQAITRWKEATGYVGGRKN